MAVQIIIEVNVNIQSRFSVAIDFSGVGAKYFVIIIAVVTSAVKSHVYPVSCNLSRVVGDHIVNAQSGAIAAQNVVNFVSQPAWIPKLHRPAIFPWRGF